MAKFYTVVEWLTYCGSLQINRSVQSLNISVDVAKCVGNVHKFTQFTHFLSFTKNGLSWLNNLIMERFLLNRMSTSVKNKLQMCWVTQHQCRRRQMFGKSSQIQPVHSLFVRYIKTTSPDWTIYSWQGFNLSVCPLMLKTSYRCVQSLNISVDVAKCVGNVHKFTQFSHFLSFTKNGLSWLNNHSWKDFTQ